MHTFILAKTHEWIKNRRQPQFLLHDIELRIAEDWLDLAKGKIPPPTPLQVEYIRASGIVARAHLVERKEVSRLGRRTLLNSAWLALVALIVVLVAVLAALSIQDTLDRAKSAELREANAKTAIIQVNAISGTSRARGEQAERVRVEAFATATQIPITLEYAETQIARATETLTAINDYIALQSAIIESQRLALAANSILQNPRGDPETALLLAIQALKIAYSPQSDAVLVNAVQFMPRQFSGHTAALTTIAISPDGHTLATGSEDTTIRLWDLRTGANLATLSGHTGVITDLAFSPDGSLLASSSRDTTVSLWDVQTARLLRTNNVHFAAVNSINFTPDGRGIISAASDSTARIWDIETFETIQAFETLSQRTAFGLISPDGSTVVTAGSVSDLFDVIQIWDMATGRQRGAFFRSFLITSATLSPNGALLLLGYDTRGQANPLELYNFRNDTYNDHLYLSDTTRVDSVAFSPDGQFVLTGGQNNISLWDANSGALIRIFPGHRADITSVAFTPDGQAILSTSQDATARAWRFASEGVVGRSRVFQGHTDTVTAVSFAEDGQVAITSGVDGTVRLWRVDSGTQLSLLDLSPRDIAAVAFSPSGDSVLLNIPTDFSTWTVRDAAGAVRILRLLPGQVGTRTVAFSVDGSRYALGGSGNTASLWNTSTGQVSQTLVGHNDEVVSVAIARDNSRLATASLDSTARVWNSVSGELVQTFEGHNGPVLSVAFSPDTQQIVTGGADQTVRVWDISSGSQLSLWVGHTDAVNAVAFSPDGSLIVSASADSTAILWNASTGQIVRILQGHGGSITSVTFSYNGRYILTGSTDGTARLWDTDYQDFITYACTRVFRDLTPAERQLYQVGPAPTCPQLDDQ